MKLHWQQLQCGNPQCFEMFNQS
ncbi:hypothetical protein YPPY32_4768, partial [Yersinia pestis PY-32]